jgi:purine-cytosine permease-like protein
MAYDPDHATDAVPLSERRGPFTMGLLWITMVTVFPCVMIGFEWSRQGLTLAQVLISTLVSCLVLLGYTVPIATLSARTGKGYSLLNKQIFGESATKFINLNLVWIFIAYYGLAALLMAEGTKSILHLNYPLPASAFAFGIMMALNNFFGFKGIANFARFLAAPILIAWVAFTFSKALPGCDINLLRVSPTQSWGFALSTVSSFVVGFALWGNEADYWRYGTPKKRNITLALACALLIGQIIFPVTGWMLSHISGLTDSVQAIAFMNRLCFGNFPIIGAFALFATYFALNDSNLFGSATAVENLFKLKHRFAVAIIAVLGAFTAAFLSNGGTMKAIDVVASLNAVILPVPTIIVITEWFLSKTMLRYDFLAPDQSILRSTGKPSLIALLTGMTFGIVTSGVVPGTEALHFGITSIQTWLFVAVLYSTLRLFFRKEKIEDFALFVHADAPAEEHRPFSRHQA